MYIFENKINEERVSKKNLYSPSLVPLAGIGELNGSEMDGSEMG